MSHPQPQSRSHPQLYPAYGPEEIDCLVATILGYLLPFYMVGSDGNGTVAGASIVALIQDCCPVTPIEFDLAGRLVGYGVAAMDNLQMSMRPGLSDAKVLQYRAGAVALGRSAEQCRKALDAIRARRELHEAATAQSIPASPSAPTPPLAPSAPASPAEPPRGMPPAQPHASVHPAPVHPASAGSHPAPLRQPAAPLAVVAALAPSACPSPAYPDSTVEGDPEFTVDIEVMKRNTRAMLVDLQARAKQFGHDAPEALLAQLVLERSPPLNSNTVTAS
jgi:hypothetical protein